MNRTVHGQFAVSVARNRKLAMTGGTRNRQIMSQMTVGLKAPLGLSGLRARGAVVSGLTRAEAVDRLKQYGPNRLKPALQRAVLLQFLAHFRNLLVLVLLATSGISALTRDVAGALIIGAIVVMSVTLDFVQAYRAGRAAERLALQVTVTATALRDGQPCELPVTDLVPGDVVLLSAGSLVPADARLLEADDFFVNQAQLTGEPYPVEKRASLPQHAAAQTSAPEDWALEATDAVFMGS